MHKQNRDDSSNKEMTKAPGDWSIKGLFAGDDSDSSSDEEEEDSVLPLEEQKRNEFSLYSSHCFGIEREIYLKTNKSRGIAHQVQQFMTATAKL